jgi:hypothetical protein
MLSVVIELLRDSTASDDALCAALQALYDILTATGEGDDNYDEDAKTQFVADGFVAAGFPDVGDADQTISTALLRPVATRGAKVGEAAVRLFGFLRDAAAIAAALTAALDAPRPPLAVVAAALNATASILADAAFGDPLTAERSRKATKASALARRSIALGPDVSAADAEALAAEEKCRHTHLCAATAVLVLSQVLLPGPPDAAALQQLVAQWYVYRFHISAFEEYEGYLRAYAEEHSAAWRVAGGKDDWVCAVAGGKRARGAE